MNIYRNAYPSATSSAGDFRRGRVCHVSEPSLTVIERAVRVQIQRSNNFTLTPGERAEAIKCLASLEDQYRVATSMEIAV